MKMRRTTPNSLRSVIAAATAAPNAIDRHAWSLIVVANRTLIDRRSSEAKAVLLPTLPENAAVAGCRDPLAAPAFNIFYNARPSSSYARPTRT
jgi:hypothetical protein